MSERQAVHVDTHHRCDPQQRYVWSYDYDDKIPNWKLVDVDDVGERRVVTCRLCDDAAIVMDCHWPWMSGGCRCAEHADFEKYPLED